MRWSIGVGLATLLAATASLSATAAAQMVVPLTTPDGRVACTQGKTGLGRPAEWQGVADPEAPDGWALTESGSDADVLRFPICISEPAVGRDLDASLRFKPVGGTAAQVAGLVLRAQSGADYYVVRANALDGSVRLYRVESGKRRQVAGKDVPIALGKWHTLRVVAIGDRFEIGLDGQTLFETTDRSLPLAGALGVWSQADSATRYGSFLVGPPLPK